MEESANQQGGRLHYLFNYSAKQHRMQQPTTLKEFSARRIREYKQIIEQLSDILNSDKEQSSKQN